jgi:hypothetical protein
VYQHISDIVHDTSSVADPSAETSLLIIEGRQYISLNGYEEARGVLSINRTIHTSTPGLEMCETLNLFVVKKGHSWLEIEYSPARSSQHKLF